MATPKKSDNPVNWKQIEKVNRSAYNSGLPRFGLNKESLRIASPQMTHRFAEYIIASKTGDSLRNLLFCLLANGFHLDTKQSSSTPSDFDGTPPNNTNKTNKDKQIKYTALKIERSRYEDEDDDLIMRLKREQQRNESLSASNKRYKEEYKATEDGYYVLLDRYQKEQQKNATLTEMNERLTESMVCVAALNAKLMNAAGSNEDGMNDNIDHELCLHVKTKLIKSEVESLVAQFDVQVAQESSSDEYRYLIFCSDDVADMDEVLLTVFNALNGLEMNEESIVCRWPETV
eukprot:122221_1